MNIEQVYAQYFTHVSPSCVHAERCGGNLVMEPDGRLYACDHLINAQHLLGHADRHTPLATLAARAAEMPFGKNKSLRRECQRCSVKSVCQGGCPAHAKIATTGCAPAITPSFPRCWRRCAPTRAARRGRCSGAPP